MKQRTQEVGVYSRRADTIGPKYRSYMKIVNNNKIIKKITYKNFVFWDVFIRFIF